MTLPSSGSISLLQVLDELRVANAGRALPIALGDADVRTLAGVPSGDIAMWQLYGKSAVTALTVTGNNDSGHATSSTAGGAVSAFPSVSYGGGAGEKTFQWSILSTSMTVTLINANNARCEVRRTFTKNTSGEVITYLRCVVSDSTGSVTVDNIIAELYWEGNI